MSRAALLRWYDGRRRAYPWRRTRDPYRVLMSEVMLQQTQAPRVVPAYRAFVRRFPSVGALAGAPRADVVRAWAGLGYNRRAAALSEAARIVVRDHAGRVPSSVEALTSLPGVGPYTAAAVASIAFGERVPAIDTNVRRVVSRWRLGLDPGDADPVAVADAAARSVPRDDPGSWNQAVMDLGRHVCRPRPRCDACPLAPGCPFRRSGRRPSSPARRQPPFDGSFRQLRGAVLDSLRERPVLALSTLASRTGQPVHRVAAAVRALAADGLLAAGPAALAGRPAGRCALSI